MHPLPRRSVFAFAALTLALWAIILFAVIHFRRGGDPRALLLLGAKRPHPEVFATAPRESPDGYDGQFYATVASDPLFLHADTRKGLDKANYRATRILVPLAAWLLAGGHGAVAVVVYQLLCWLLAVAAVCVVAFWLHADGRSVWWAGLLVFNAGIATSILRSTPDAAALSLLLAALVAAHTRRGALPTVLATLATVARETFYLGAAALAIDAFRRGDRRGALRLALVPLAVFGAWKLFLRSRVGISINVLRSNFGAPFAWLPTKAARVLAAGALGSAETWGFLAVLATFVAVGVVLLRDRERDATWLLFVAFGCIAALASLNVYAEVYAYGRVLIATPFLALPIASRLRSAWERWTVRSVPILFAVSGLLLVRDHLPAALLRLF